jgi:hypothetical protein
MTRPESPRRPRSFGVDVARGACLLIMTLDHLPRHPFGRFSNAIFGPLGFFTALSAFVFLSGLVSAWVYGGILRSEGLRSVFKRATRRALQLYAVNTSALLLLLGCVSLGLLNGPEWREEFPLFYSDPWRALWQGLLLVDRPGYLDILPMYVLFMVVTPLVLLAIRSGRGWLVAALSGFAWFVVQLPPLHEQRPLNPFGYLVLFAAGLLLGSQRDLGARLSSPAAVRWAKLSLAFAAALCALRLGPVILGIGLPQTELWRTLTDVDRNGILRLLNFALFALGAAYVWRRVEASLLDSRPVRLLAYLGQHSLPVFVWSVMVSYVSMALMPPAPSALWRAGDVLLCLFSLGIPAKLDAVGPLVPWLKATFTVPQPPAEGRPA